MTRRELFGVLPALTFVPLAGSISTPSWRPDPRTTNRWLMVCGDTPASKLPASTGRSRLLFANMYTPLCGRAFDHIDVWKPNDLQWAHPEPPANPLSYRAWRSCLVVDDGSMRAARWNQWIRTTLVTRTQRHGTITRCN